MRVYISGPITGLDPAEVERRFGEAEAWLAARGHDPVNPLKLQTLPGCRCPGAVGVEGTNSGHAWSCYMRKDFAALLTCDAILLLDGWRDSHGARRELDMAATTGLDVWLAGDPVVVDVLDELDRAEAKFPDQHLRSGTGPDVTWGITGPASWVSLNARSMCQDADKFGALTWLHVLREEVAEAFAESDPKLLRAELVQVAAMAVRWIKDIDRRPAVEPAEVSGG